MQTAGISVPHHPQIDFLAGVWRLVDPKIALASLVPFIAGTAIARDQGRAIPLLIAFGAFVAIFLVEVGKNAINDLIDFRSGADLAVAEEDRSPFSGGKRTLVDGLVTERELAIVAWVAMLAAGVVGATVAFLANPLLLLLGAAAAAIAAVYSIPPVKLSYRGLGETAVMLTYGPGIVIGTVLLFGGTVTLDVLAAAFSLGLLIGNVLLINEVPDERADRGAGKRTLVVRLGRQRAGLLFAAVFALAFTLPVVRALGGGDVALLGLLLGAIPAQFAVTLLRRETTRPPVAAQGATLITYVAAGLGLTAALFM